MKSWKKPTNELIDNALQSTKKETGRKYFFSRLKNPLWLKPLAERGCFKYPPKNQQFDDGTVQFPYWPELQYLKNVSRDMPNEVIDLVLRFPTVDNPVIYDGILDIALQLPGEHSAKLKPKILEYTGLEHQWRTHRYTDMLAYWVKENQLSTALELSKILVMFSPDPQSAEKQKRRKEDPISWGTLLHPLPRIGPWEYARIMADGVRPLAKRIPYKVAHLLIDCHSKYDSVCEHILKNLIKRKITPRHGAIFSANQIVNTRVPRKHLFIRSPLPARKYLKTLKNPPTQL